MWIVCWLVRLPLMELKIQLVHIELRYYVTNWSQNLRNCKYRWRVEVY